MKRQYAHEAHNRQDKVWKGGGACPEGKESPGLWSYFITHNGDVRRTLNLEVARRLQRQELMEFFDAEIRRWRFIVAGRKFMFSWSAKQFADANALNLLKAKTVFDRVREEAEDRLRIVKQRICQTGFRLHHEHDEAGNLVEVHTLNYDDLEKFLQRDV